MTAHPDSLIQLVRQLIRQEMSSQQGASLALVQETHPDTYACTVKLQDNDIVLQEVPVASQRLGMVSIPQVNHLVLVQFIGGDINHPIIVGSLYNDEDTPPANEDQQWIVQLPLGAEADEGIHLSADTIDAPRFSLQLGSNLALLLQDDDPVVQLDVGSGSARLQIDSDGSITLESQKDLTLEAGGDLKLKGANIEAEASGETNIKGSVVNIN